MIKKYKKEKKKNNLVSISLLLAVVFFIDFIPVSKVQAADTSPSASGMDISPPVINVLSPSNGQILKGEASVQVTFTVTDNVALDEVFFNGDLISPLNGNQYSGNVDLEPGENLIFFDAIDTSNNESSAFIIVTYLSSDTSDDNSQGKKAIILPSEIEDLNEELINQFTKITSEGEFIDIGSFTSVEIANPPDIPEGAEAKIEVPEIEGLEAEIPEGPVEVPKGFSFATNVDFNKDEIVNITEEEKQGQNSAILVDSTGRVFIVGFGFLKEAEGNNLARNKKYRFQTLGGTPLKLITTFTVPADATEGNATVSVLSKNQALATIPLRVTPSKEVKIGKRILGKPQIVKPINAVVKKSASELKVVIKGKNFVGHIATIDGKLQKLLSKAQFFTNVTFVPSEGIEIKKFKLLKNKIVLTAKLKNDIVPGVKLFNVITPKGADIGGIVFPDPIKDGKLETTTAPERLILGH